MDIECPYCEFEQGVNHDDGQNYEEGVLHHMECEQCEKNFTFYTAISFYYESQKADCLNGGEHNWRQIATYPKEYTKMGCKDCGEEREPTEKEWKRILKL